MRMRILVLVVLLIIFGIQGVSYGAELGFVFEEDVTRVQDPDPSTQSTTTGDTTDVRFYLRTTKDFVHIAAWTVLTVEGDIDSATITPDRYTMLAHQTESAALFTFTIPRDAINEAGPGEYEFTITVAATFPSDVTPGSVTLELTVLGGEGKIADRVIRIVGGNEQEEFVGNTLPFFLRVEVINERTFDLYADVEVTFAIVQQPEGNSGAFLSDTSVLTDAEGYARTVMTLGDTAGPYRVEASISDAEFDRVVFIVTALSDSNAGVTLGDTESLESIDSLSQTTPTTDIDDVTYTFLVTNTGSESDTIDLTLSGDIANLILSHSELSLDADSSQEVTLTVPRGALTEVGTYEVTVTATPRNNNRATAEINLSTIVTGTSDDEETDGQLQQALKTVVFSEFMFESDGGDDGLPQWLEVYNNSNSEKNLRGWQLQWIRWKPTLLNVTTTFQEDFIIPAQQARLIVTSLGRHSGSNILSSDSVYQLLNMHTEELLQDDIINRNHLITRGGFSLKLLSPNDVLIDQISNLKDGKKEWKLPLCLINGIRTSVIRRFDDGVPREGTERSGWRRAIDSKNLIAGIYYGNPNDLGTPGYRRGKPLPVELSHFSAQFTKNKVVIAWTTESELNNAGFNILRSTSRTENFSKLNPQLIKGAGTTGARNEYQFIDKTAKPNLVYYYRIEDIDFSGKSEILKTQRLRGYVSPADKVITTWSTLKTNR